MILDLFRYIYYRMAHAYMNFGWSKSFSYHCSNSNVGVCISSNIMTVALIIAYFMVGNLQRNQLYFIAIAIILITGIPMSKIFYMRDDDKFYDELNLKYKDEKHRIIKGGLVFLYFLLSVIGCVCCVILVI